MVIASMPYKSVYQLVDGVLDEGLGYVASYLEKMIQRPLIITDNSGKIYYPSLEEDPQEINDMFVELPCLKKNKTYLRKEENRSLYYRVICGNTSAFIVVKDIPPELLDHTLSLLKEASLAVKCYFSKLNKSEDRFGKELGDYLTCISNIDIRDIAALSDKNLDVNKPYFVLVIRIGEINTKAKIDWHMLSKYSQEYFRRSKIDIIAIARCDSLLIIIPARFINDSMDLDQNWPNSLIICNFKELISKKLSFAVSMGIGQIYPLIDLRKSYNEACTAIDLQLLMGNINVTQHFSELGIFSLLFGQDTCTLKSYCFNTLVKLLDYDDKAEGRLLPTLRELLDNSLNFKDTADRLYIHINTLYYRINRIEEILGLDLSQMFNRVNLYLAIKIWDMLQIIDDAN